MQDGLVNLNHGSFGTVPRVVAQAQRRYSEQCERVPDDWFRGGYQGYINSVRPRLAALVGADAEDCVFVENASGGVNAVLRSLEYSADDTVVIYDTAYPMVQNTLKYLSKRYGFNVHILNVTFPISSSAVFTDPLKTLLAQTKVKLVVFSHIASTPAVILPVKAIASISRQHGALSLVDGAHALGAIRTNLTDLDADFYVANAHKWLYSPKGSAFLHVRKDKQALVVPTVISSTGNFDFIGEFEYTGTRDYTPFCAIGDALDFRQRLGEEAIFDYTHGLVEYAVETLTELWNTTAIAPVALQGTMANVELPITDYSVVGKVRKELMDSYSTTITPYQRDGRNWVRLSCPIYIDRADIDRFGQLVLELKDQFSS